MISSRYRWDMADGGNETAAAALCEALGVPPLVAKVLAARGWTDPGEAAKFLQADENELHDPFLLSGMAEAVDRIRRGLQGGERIRVYGDYDADGVTSTALMSRLLTELDADFDIYIPHRGREGYGLNIAAIDLAYAAGVKLLVTVDNGISALEQITYARQKGIDVVVTDHHEPPAQLPADAIAIVNPKRRDCSYPFKGLCGAGVAFKLAHALLGRPALEYADLAAIGTIADLMPLLGENRAIATLGLERMRKRPSPGIRALAGVSGTEPKDLSCGRIGFGLAPRLNAGGRLDSANGAVRLLVTEDAAEASQLAGELDLLNAERQRLVEQTAKEADARWKARLAEWREEKERGSIAPSSNVATDFTHSRTTDHKLSSPGEGPRVIVLAGEGWNPGIAGLVASRLVELYYRPAIVLAYDPESGLCKGSARSIDGFDFYEALTGCADLLDHFGGHQAAAGMTLAYGCVRELERRLDNAAGQKLRAEDWQPKRKVDYCCSLAEASLAAATQLERLAPFGSGNPTPRLRLSGLTLKESRKLGKEGKHLKLTMEQQGRTIDAVGFGFGGFAGRLAPGSTFDLLGELSVNEWNGNRSVQLLLQDLRSDNLQLFDLRKTVDFTGEIERLFRERGERLVVFCRSRLMESEVLEWLFRQGAPIVPYDGYKTAAAVSGQAETAAAKESGLANEGVAAAKVSGWKNEETAMANESSRTGAGAGAGAGAAARTSALPLHLILVDLPESVAEIEAFEAAVGHALQSAESVFLFSSHDRPSVGASLSRSGLPRLPDRQRFAEVYALFQRQQSWIDAPDGFLRQVADRTGLVLAEVRFIQDVFEELGFIRASGAERHTVASPDKRPLQQSARYRKAERAAEASRIASLSAAEMREWLERVRDKQRTR